HCQTRASPSISPSSRLRDRILRQDPSPTRRLWQPCDRRSRACRSGRGGCPSEQPARTHQKALEHRAVECRAWRDGPPQWLWLNCSRLAPSKFSCDQDQKSAFLDVRDAGMACRSRTRSGPEKLAVSFVDRDVVDAGFPPTHLTIVVEFPEFVSVATEPLPGAT